MFGWGKTVVIVMPQHPRQDMIGDLVADKWLNAQVRQAGISALLTERPKTAWPGFSGEAKTWRSLPVIGFGPSRMAMACGARCTRWARSFLVRVAGIFHRPAFRSNSDYSASVTSRSRWPVRINIFNAATVTGSDLQRAESSSNRQIAASSSRRSVTSRIFCLPMWTASRSSR